MNVTNRECAVVTGAGSGIGRQVAIRLASSGYRIVLMGRRAERLDSVRAGLDGNAHFVMPCDVTDPAGVERAAESPPEAESEAKGQEPEHRGSSPNSQLRDSHQSSAVCRLLLLPGSRR